MKLCYRSINYFVGLLALAIIFSAALVVAQTHPPYNARVKVYVVEPESRWSDYYYTPYGMGFLAFAYDTVVTMNYLDSLNRTITWDGAAAGFGDIQQDNIMVIAVIFSGDSTLKYSDPPLGYPFYAHAVDAAAAATPSQQWPNSTSGGYTHTVFVEVGTGSWCPNCPPTNNTMHAIFSSGSYNFFYTELIEDWNVTAHNHVINDFNQHWFPTTYFEGGNRLFIGGSSTQSDYTTFINEGGARDVHLFDLSTNVAWLGGGSLSIQLHLKNNEVVNQTPAVPDAPTGPSMSGPQGNCTFNASAIDPEGDQMYYRFFWKVGDTSNWFGPYNSGATCSATHKWTDSIIAQVMVQSRDEYGTASAWSGAHQVIIRSYLAGDANHNGAINILDVSYLINYLYKHGPFPNPVIAGDVNGNSAINILDVSYLINFLYKGGAEPKYPL
jgi:hypothetical protein